MGARVIRRVLVANRGEIAVRILCACRELGLTGIAIYSDADSDALHVRMADVSARVGPAPAAESYISTGAVIDAARQTGADAVHPGYGFLAENAEFADACAGAGLVFVGPPASVIETMGSKIGSRASMSRAGIPVVPGETPRDQSEAAFREAAARVGFPLLIKASAGGGGKGMRMVRCAEDLAQALEGARHEARVAFGDETLYIERVVERPRHVEIQLLADGHGNVLHLFERDCSVQRRHQKIVEESPSPAVTPALRERMTATAVAAARAIDYRNAGTIEFLVEGTGDEARFYFLEMNTRLQVEHPVTEAVTGIDLVRAQFQVAAGRPIAFRQQDVAQRGNAVECRIYAEDPANDFLPQAGRLTLYRPPCRPGIRIDSGVAEGCNVPVNYDPLLAKLVAHGETRSMALERARLALSEFAILGPRTNVPFLVRLLQHPAVRSGDLDTWFLQDVPADLLAGTPDGLPIEVVAAVAAFEDVSGGNRGALQGEPGAARNDPWDGLTGWRAWIGTP
ncbi:MAG: acetyl/propionyl/methylcrotonyl-CoA carboxylase subunit alpha [Vicinamibacterales bacterium]